MPVHPYIRLFPDKTADPSILDDSSQGYEKGDQWINTVTKSVFTAIDVTVGAAVWVMTSSGTVSLTVTKSQKVMTTKTLLYDNILSADGAGWDFSGISQGYDHLKLEVMARSMVAAVNSGIAIALNNDTTDANYRKVSHRGSDGSGHTTYGANDRIILLAPGTTAADANQWMYATELDIPWYTGNKIKYAQSNVLLNWSAIGGSSMEEWNIALQWNSTAAINRVALSGYAGSLKAGSRLRIWGVKDELVTTDMNNVNAVVSPVIFGGTFSFPNLVDFSWVNQRATTASQGNGLVISSGNTDNQVALLVKSAPATPYVLTAILAGLTGSSVNNEFGICFRESSSGKIHAICHANPSAGTLFSRKWTNPSTFSADYLSLVGLYYGLSSYLILRISDDGTNRVTSFSVDGGYNYTQLSTVGRTDFLTADQVGIYVRSGSADLKLSVLSFQ